MDVGVVPGVRGVAVGCWRRCGSRGARDGSRLMGVGVVPGERRVENGGTVDRDEGDKSVVTCSIGWASGPYPKLA